MFNIGDKVVCIENKTNYKFTKGKVYEVYGYQGRKNSIESNSIKSDCGIEVVANHKNIAKCFELYQDNLKEYFYKGVI